MRIAPAADAAVDQKGCGGDGGYEQDEQGAQAGQQGQIHRKADEAGQKLRQGGPDRFRSGGIIAGDGHGFILGVQKIRLQRVGKGGACHLFRDLPYQIRPDGDAAEQGILIQVGVQRRQRHEQQGENRHGAKQDSKRVPVFHMPQDHRSDQQLRRCDGGGGDGDGDAEKKDAFLHVPGIFQHVDGILPRMILRFLFFIHCILILSFWLDCILAQKKAPVSGRGRIVRMGG